MTGTNQKQLGNTLWKIADDLRGAMNASDFQDYMLSFFFLHYLSDNYETAAKKELGRDDPESQGDTSGVPLARWYAGNLNDVAEFEKQMRRKVHYVIRPEHLWSSITSMARTQSQELLNTRQPGFKYIETESFENTFAGLFSEIELASDKLGKTYADRNAKLCTVIQKIAEGLAEFSTDVDVLGDAYEYLIGQFAAGAGKKAGEFHTPQQMSNVLSAIVTLDSQEPQTDTRKRLESVLDMACGSGSLPFNVRHRMKATGGTIEPLDQVSSGLMEEAAKQAEPGLATIARAVLAARQDAICLLVPGQRLSSTATLLPESGPAGDVAAWVESWKEAIRLARQREGN